MSLGCAGVAACMAAAVPGIAGPGAAMAASGAAAAAQQPPPVTGKLTATGMYSFTVQTPGQPGGMLNAFIGAANHLAGENIPYVWGGGHNQAGIPSIGSPGPGFNGRSRGYDCSGAVAAELVSLGLWPGGSSVPTDAGVVQNLLARGLIAPGAGVGPRAVTVYDHPGVHIFLNIEGRFFGTSDGDDPGGDPQGGPGWIDDSAPDVRSHHFRRYHFLPSVLRTSAGDASTFGFRTSHGLDMAYGYPVGARVSVAYRDSNTGSLVATSVKLIGERTVSGAITGMPPSFAGFTMRTTEGNMRTFPLRANTLVAAEAASGRFMPDDEVTVSYVRVAGAMYVVGVKVTGRAPQPKPEPKPKPVPPTTTTTPPPTTTTPPPTTTPTTTTPTITTPPPTGF